MIRQVHGRRSRGGGVPPGICLWGSSPPPGVLNAIFSCCVKCMFQPYADDVINQKYNISARQEGDPHPFVASTFRPPPPDITRNRRHWRGSGRSSSTWCSGKTWPEANMDFDLPFLLSGSYISGLEIIICPHFTLRAATQYMGALFPVLSNLQRIYRCLRVCISYYFHACKHT